jgi:hypothetical protein
MNALDEETFTIFTNTIVKERVQMMFFQKSRMRSKEDPG